MSSTPIEVFRGRAQAYDQEAEARKSEARLLSFGRLAAFLVGAGLLIWLPPTRSPLHGAALLAVVAVFSLLVVRHRAAKARHRRVQLLATYNRESIARLERRWDDAPLPPPFVHDPGHGYVRDLDIDGRASLLHLLGTPSTAVGWGSLREWVLKGPPPEETRLRQDGVKEAIGELDLREAVAAEGRLASELVKRTGGDAEAFLQWAEGSEPLLSFRGFAVAAACLLPVTNVGTGLGVYFGVLPTPFLSWSLLISAAVLGLVSRSVHRGFSRASDGEAGIRGYGRTLRVLEETSLETDWWRELRTRLGGSSRPAHSEIDRLRTLLDMADLRLSPLFHIPLALFLFWDVHVAWGMERWRTRSGQHVRDWLTAIGDAEALLALSSLAYSHSGWEFPEVDRDASSIEAESLGHPLLAPDTAVRNDVRLGPPGSFLLVTGSNMAGKSTLLRAVGLNVVLGRMGGPVCADSLTIPPLSIWTSMRVDDSLASGLSFFMAELERLKTVVVEAEAGRGRTRDGGEGEAINSDAEPVLYLLDEILQGTNTAERQVAARTVIRRLLASGAIGAVTTHDLTLADAPDLAAASVPVHFTETVKEGEEGSGLSFDYQLREGISPSTNALKLLRLVGLEGPAEPGEG